MNTSETIALLVNSLPAADKARLLKSLQDTPTTTAEAPRVLKAPDVAARLHCTARTVYGLASQGHLRRITLPGRKRGCGFLESEVDALMERNG
jgi:hypothetical protein